VKVGFSMSVAIRVLLVDDHEIVRSGIRRLLEEERQLEVIAEASNGEQAYQLVNELKPDVVVLDMIMPGISGLETLRRIQIRDRTTKVIVFSMHSGSAYATQALKAGARAYIAKTDNIGDLPKAIFKVNSGGNFLSENMAHKIALSSFNGGDNLMNRLTGREFETFRLLAEGYGIEAIAKTLQLSNKTVANYQTILRNKLDIHSPIALVRLALQYDVIAN